LVTTAADISEVSVASTYPARTAVTSTEMRLPLCAEVSSSVLPSAPSSGTPSAAHAYVNESGAGEGVPVSAVRTCPTLKTPVMDADGPVAKLALVTAAVATDVPVTVLKYGLVVVATALIVAPTSAGFTV
jgi:hypothetical protein